MAKTISIPVELLRQLLDYSPDTGELFWRPRPLEMFRAPKFWRTWNSCYAGKKAGTDCKSARYIKVTILGKRYLLHRVLWALHYGEWPNKIDHAEGNGQDNRIEEMSNVDSAGNSHNLKRFKTNKSGVTGVSQWKKSKKWRADITVNRKHIHLGTFDTKAGAVEVRRAREIKHGFHPNHGR